MSANLRQDTEPVQVNGTLSTVCLGSGVGICSAEKPYTQQHQDLQAHNAFPLGKEAERPGTWENPASVTALHTCPLKMAFFCYAEQGVKQSLVMISWDFSETRFTVADPADAADPRAGAQVPFLPS